MKEKNYTENMIVQSTIIRLEVYSIVDKQQRSSPCSSSRKLVTIRTINDIQPIEGADAIELVKIDGWQCVAKKNEFKVNDLCVYFEIDSFLPICDSFEFLRSKCYRKMCDKEGFRLKSTKFRNALSQGLALPISLLSNFTNDIVKVGDEVTDILGVIKFEPFIPAELQGQVKGNFPNFIPKTDEERIQNLKSYFTDFKDVEFLETTKLNGTSMTVYYYDDNNEVKTGVCGRNFDFKISDTQTQWVVAKQYKIIENLEKMKRNLALQGECVGPKIQGNYEKVSNFDFYIFKIFDIDKQRYLLKDEFENVIQDLHELGCMVKTVPFVGTSKICRR